MSFGLRVWDATGQLTLEVTDRIGRYHGTITLGNTAARGSTNYPVPGYSLDGTWFLFFRGLEPAYLKITEQAGNISIFNEDYYAAHGSGTFIDIFRG